MAGWGMMRRSARVMVGLLIEGTMTLQDGDGKTSGLGRPRRCRLEVRRQDVVGLVARATDKSVSSSKMGFRKSTGVRGLVAPLPRRRGEEKGDWRRGGTSQTGLVSGVFENAVPGRISPATRGSPRRPELVRLKADEDLAISSTAGVMGRAGDKAGVDLWSLVEYSPVVWSK